MSFLKAQHSAPVSSIGDRQGMFNPESIPHDTMKTSYVWIVTRLSL